MPRQCSHGRTADVYLPEWESLYEGLPGGMTNFGCPCEPPRAWDIRVANSHRQILLEAQLERERWDIEWARKNKIIKSPGKIGEDDESSGRWYFITFTQPDTDKDPTRLLKATSKVINSKQVSAIHWCYSLELTESGTPHTHIRLFTNKYFDYKKIANFNGGFRSEVTKEKWNVSKYVLKKDINDEYLATHDLNQWYWNSNDYFATTGAVIPA